MRRIILTSLLFLALTSSAFAANRYWVGGTASWDGTAGTKWALTSGGGGGQAVPTSTDDCFFDAASGVSTVTIVTVGATCNNLDFTGFTGTLAGSQALAVSGSLTMSTGMTKTWTGPLTLNSTVAGKTITSNGKTFGNTVILSSAGTGGGTWSLQDNFVTSSSFQVTGTSTVFDLNNFNLTTTNVILNNGSTQRTFTFGSGTVFLTGTGTVWNGGTNFLTINANTGTIKVINNTANAVTVATGGYTYPLIWFDRGGSTTTINLTNSVSNTISEIRDSGFAAHSLLLSSGTTYNVSAFRVGGSINNLITLGSIGSTAFTINLSSGVVNAKFLSIASSTATPTNSWYAGSQSTNVVNNSGWIFDSPRANTSIYSGIVRIFSGLLRIKPE